MDVCEHATIATDTRVDGAVQYVHHACVECAETWTFTVETIGERTVSTLATMTAAA